MLEAHSLVKRFGPITAVDGISLTVKRGEVLGFLGPNGAGKSTTMKMLTGFLSPTKGRATVCGHDVAAAPIQAKRRLGYLPEGAPLYEDMTAAGFLDFIADVRGLAGSHRAHALKDAIAAVHIESVLDRPVGNLSKGFRRRVGLAQAILHDPDVLILDEPTDGLDPNQKHEVRRLIEGMAERKAIVVSTHILEEVEALCTRAVIIDRGRIVADGTPAELKARSRYHNAVTVQLPAKDADKAAKAFEGLDGVAAVEIHREDGLAEVTVLAADGAKPLDAVRGKAGSAGIDVRQIAVEPGRLDDVFRALTHSDAATEADRAEEEKAA